MSQQFQTTALPVRFDAADSETTRPSDTRRSTSADPSRGHRLRRFATFVAALLDRRARTEADIVKRYEGCSWCDSTERALNDDIANDRRTRR